MHFIILQEELEKAGAPLILVTESLDSSDLGKLKAYVKGYAAKLEAQKIKERTSRSLKQRAKAGKIPSGHRGRLYGYYYPYGYVDKKKIGRGIRSHKRSPRYCSETDIQLVCKRKFRIRRIARELISEGIPTPTGKTSWRPAGVSG